MLAANTPRPECPQVDLNSSARVFFMHIPKTAGTTLGVVIDPYLPRPRYPHYDALQLDSTTTKEASQYRSIVGHVAYTQVAERWQDGFTALTVLRQPLARFVSSFFQRKRADNLGDNPSQRMLFEDQILKTMSLDQFVASERLKVLWSYINIQTRMLAGQISGPEWRNASSLTELMEKMEQQSDSWALLARQRLNKMAFVGLTERFQDSLLLLSFTFGWRPFLDNLRMNVNPSPHRLDELDPQTMTLLERYNAMDQPLYDYASRLFDGRYEQMVETLLERYGTRRHALLPRPLPLEVLIELLERHYESRMTARQAHARQNARPMLAHINMDEFIESPRNWYPVEITPDGVPFRWSGPKAPAQFDLPLRAGESDREFTITLRVLHSATPEIADGLRMSINGKPIFLRRAWDGQGAQLFSGHVTGNAVRGSFARIELSHPDCLQTATSNPESADERRLGIALEWIEISPC